MPYASAVKDLLIQALTTAADCLDPSHQFRWVNGLRDNVIGSSAKYA
ncbi:MAG TPA: hypothetical protein VFS96_04740 [Nitrolancea sp.]|nr:hypothetical protein [Nitrolancea sp.]